MSLRERSAAVPRTSVSLKITMPFRRSDAYPEKEVTTLVCSRVTVLAENATDRPCLGPDEANRRVASSGGSGLEGLKTECLQTSLAVATTLPDARSVWADVYPRSPRIRIDFRLESVEHISESSFSDCGWGVRTPLHRTSAFSLGLRRSAHDPPTRGPLTPVSLRA